MLAGGLATWLSERRKLSDELRNTNVLSGVVSAYGGLFTSPFAFVLMRLELAHRQTPAYFGTIVIATVAATIGFSLFYAAAGQEFAELLNFAQDKLVVRVEPDEEEGLLVYLGEEFYPSIAAETAKAAEKPKRTRRRASKPASKRPRKKTGSKK